MRVVLLGGQTALLAGLMAFGAWRVTRPRPPATPEPVAEQAEPPVQPVPARSFAHRSRELPTVAAPPCTPRPGHACWRGQVRLSDKVRKLWEEDRARAERAAEAEELADDGPDDDAEAGVAGTAAGEDPLPPLGPWTAHAAIHAYRRKEPTKEPTGTGGAAGEKTKGVHDGTLHADGTFEVQVPPGVYDVEVDTFDGSLVAFAEGLSARAGAAEGGLELVMVPTVAIAGRVVDEEGIGVEAQVWVALVARPPSRIGTPTTGGGFQFLGLRPGAYRVTAMADGTTRDVTVDVQAPATGVELRLRWLPEGLVLVAPRPDGTCPSGRLELRPSAGGRPDRLHFEDCQSHAGYVRPGVAYRVKGTLAGKAYDTEVVFAGAPAAPICLDARCGPDAAARIRVVDLAGTPVEGFTVLEMQDVGVRSVSSSGDHYRGGLRAGLRVDVRARLGNGEDAPTLSGTTHAWLTPGINQIVVRLPEIVAPQP